MFMSSVLSALLLGLFPVTADIPPPSPPLASLVGVSIAPPAERILIGRRLSASGVIVVDLASGQTVYGSQADIERPMASLTKLMTALLIVENHDLQEWVTIPKDIVDTPGSVAYLSTGEQFTVGDLLSALLIASANDAAVTLARFHSGSTEMFAKEMNARATSLGLTGTQYANASGMDDPRQWSTPRDIARLTMFIQKEAEIRKRLALKGTVIRSKSGKEIPLTHTHALLRARNPLVEEGKTGTTNAAGQCLVSVVGKNGHEYVVVLLRSQKRYDDMQAILLSLFGASEATETPVQDTECAQGGGCSVVDTLHPNPVP
ncbi:MAG: serine hydrolase [Candidatus Peregrinibacteria bacterium]